MKKWKKICYADDNKKRARVAYIYHTKQTLSQNCQKSQRRSSYNDKSVSSAANKTIINTYVSNIRTPKNIRQTHTDRT